MDAPKQRKSLSDIAKRAQGVKKDPSLRHYPSEHDISAVAENTRIMYHSQLETIKPESGDE